jgi:dipeptidyl aminopeptidase/acylaminoacyl peptidase
MGLAKTLLLSTVLASFAVSASAMEKPKAPPAPAVPDVPLIPRDKLFGNPSRGAAEISPDGKWLAWTAPRDGVMNIWVAPVGDLSKERPLTSEKVRPIRTFNWAPNSATILYQNDKGGDENFLLYDVNITTGEERKLTPYEKVRVMILGASLQVPNRIIVGINDRDPRWHDAYSLDLKTGKLTLLFKNVGNYGNAITDKQLNIRLVSRTRPDGGYDYFSVRNNKPAQTPAFQIDFADTMTTVPLGFAADGKTLHWLDSRGRNTAALVDIDVTTGKSKVVAERADSDLSGQLITVPQTGEIVAYAANYKKPEWIALNEAVKADIDVLNKELQGAWSLASQTAADDAWTVVSTSASAPAVMYLYDRKAKKLTKLYDTRPELNDAPLVDMQALEIKSRDGLTHVAYLTLPKGSDANNDGKPEKPVPMVLLVHGGPWARDNYGFNRTHQWLANRGYAVLSTNYRSSTGFGKSYIAAGNLQWGTTMHDDLIDAVEWSITNGITTRDKVAIMGGSYGGYATLAGLTFTPDTFACGVDIVGPSNLLTLLASIPAYWESERVQLYARVGNPTTDEGKKLLMERSPLFKADAIKKPLLIGQGANDPRVKQAESDQIVTAMKAKNIPVTYVLFPDEGHGFARPANNTAFNAVTEEFLLWCLGGRAEPIGNALKPSTITVPAGAEFVPNLKAALDAKAAP